MSHLLQVQAVRERCSENVQDGGFRSIRCSKFAKVQVGPKWYCSVHDPNAVAERRKTKSKRDDERYFAREKAHHRAFIRAETWVRLLDLLERAPRFGGASFGQTYRAWQAERNRMLEEVTGMTKGERDAVER